ncbi:hypothetical protein ACKQTC_06520 [Peptococcus simiae]|uniref:Uncharacterized protein n=1 Tax=Peptococcus simiae TaxID=1643805 RepID=A0ABW9H162_9FIRM
MVAKLMKAVVLIKGIPMLLGKVFKLLVGGLALVGGYKVVKKYNLTDYLPDFDMIKRILDIK